MGLIQLSEFRSDVDTATGNRSIADAAIDRATNFAYFDISGGIRFQELHEEHSINASVGTVSYAGPTDGLQWDFVYSETDDITLTYVPLIEFYALDRSTNGTPSKWSRYQNNVLLWYPPDASDSLKLVYYKEPTALSEGSDTTVLRNTWDLVIFYLSVAHIHMLYAEEDRAAFWTSRAANYIQSRLIDEEGTEGVEEFVEQLRQRIQG